MMPVWEAVKAATDDSGIVFHVVDENVAKTPGITGYPTILMTTETGKTYKYGGGADFATLRAWIVSPNLDANP
jgi:hypothetical protein